MDYYITLNHGQEQYEVALWHQETMLASRKEAKYEVSKHAVTVIDTLLNAHQKTIFDLDGIVLNAGPGPFATLRALVTIANACNFAAHVPLIGVNSLEALVKHYPSRDIVIALLNAFNKELYFALQEKEKPLAMGCAPYMTLLTRIKEQYPQQTVHFIGQGAALYGADIKALYQEYAYIPDPLPHFCSTEQLAALGREKWKQGETTMHVTPLYLKNLSYSPAL